MTIKECIDAVDNIKPNQYSIKEKVQWLSFIDEIIINDVLRTHEGYDGRYDDFEGYSENKLSESLIVGSPYDRLYTAYLKMKIDEENGEMAKYNNSAAMFNAYLMEYRKHYNKTHMPLDVTKINPQSPQNKKPSNIPDAVYENIKRELYALLSENFADMVSDDKIYDIVMRFVNNNIELLKGKDGQDGVDGEDGYTPRKNIDYFDGEKGDKGDTPKKGVDYWTVDDKKGIKDDINSTLSGEYVKRDAYNTDIQQLQVNVANLNSMVPSLDLAVQQLQGDVGSIETALDSIIAMQNSLIGGDAYWVLQKSLLQLQRMCRKFIRVDRMIF